MTRPSPVRLLLAEDSALMRTVLKSVLAGMPEFVLVGEAVSGQQAIDMTRAQQPEVLLIDLNLPEVDGVEATRQIREENHDVIVIGMSALVDPYKEETLLAAGAAGCLCKLDIPDQLLPMVQAALAGGTINH